MTNPLPKGWNLIKFGNVVEEVRTYEKKPLENGLERYVGLEHIDPESLQIKRWGLIKEGTTFIRKFNKGQVLFGRRRAYQRKTAIADFDGVCSGDIMVFSAKNGLIPELLPFIIQSERFYNCALDTSAGSLSPRTKMSFLKDFEFRLPNLDLQQRIANVLWAIENTICCVVDAIEIGKKYKRVLMQHLLTKGIRHRRFKNSLLGKLPSDWEVIQLKDIGKKWNDIVAGPFGSNLKVCDYLPNGVPIIRLQNIERNLFINKEIMHISSEKAEELQYHSYLPGDIALAKLGDPVGKTCIIPESFKPGIVVADVVRIRVDPNKASKEFIVYILNSNMCATQFIRDTTGSTRPRVNLLQIRDLRIPLPSLSEQCHIASILTNLDKAIEKVEEHKESVRGLKNFLLNGLLSGEILLGGDN